MAGDWIKMRTDLGRDPAVIALCDLLARERNCIIGALHTLWSWADEQTHDGNAVGVTEKWIDAHVCVTGFAQAMVKVGWLYLTEHGVSIPRFDKHNGESAKKRALSNKRVKRYRNADSVTDALPEKRREEKKKYPPKPPQGGADEVIYKSKRQRPLTAEQAAAAALKDPYEQLRTRPSIQDSRPPVS